MTRDYITIGELKAQYLDLTDDDKIYLPGQLTFYRLKSIGQGKYYMEPNEPQAYLSDEFKGRNPQLKVAFMRTDNVEWDDDGITGGPIDVELR